MAHKDIDQVCHLIEYFQNSCYLFVHLDRKHKLNKDERERLESYPQVVKVYQKYDVRWGGFNMLRCEMFILKEVLKLCDADYLHLISGQDYPIMPLGDFLQFFEQYKDKDCLRYTHLPHIGWEGNTFSRLQYYYPYDLYCDRNWARYKVGKFLSFQKRIKIKRSLPKQFDHFYGSSQWFSITRETAKMILNYTHRHPSFYRRMWMTFAPEETYVATVVVNLKKGKNVLFTNFRYVRMKYENGNCPANLGKEHLVHLLKNKYAFVRKIELPFSKDIRDVLDKYFVYDNHTLIIMENGGWIYDGYRMYSFDRLYFESLIKTIQVLDIYTVLDVGCGAGMDVALLRERGIAASGFDANPYTESLSERILVDGQPPCIQADLLEDDTEAESPFDLVTCKDVIPYIPQNKIAKAIKHLTRLSGKYIILRWYNNDYVSELPYNHFPTNEIVTLMEMNGFEICSNKLLTMTGKNTDRICMLFKAK
jgi:16S RNA G1207 methylase RsmC